MSLSDALGDKLDLPGVKTGAVEVETGTGRVQVDLADAARPGARIDRLRVSVPNAAPLETQAKGICRRLRHLPERLVPVEVDERLGGGVLRSDPADMRGKRYFEIGLDGTGATVERFKASPDGGREREPFTVTREQLGRLVDDLAHGLRSEDDSASS